MKRTLPLAVALTLSACAFVDPHNMIGRRLGEASVPTTPVPAVRTGPLEAAARARAFDFVWNTINDRYHDANLNGVDWKAAAARFRPAALQAKDDDAFWDTLDRMTGELKDAHTRVDSPKAVELRQRDQSITLGFGWAPIEGRLAVTGVNTESDAWWAGVRPGMTLAAIEGEPAAAAYEKLMADTRQDSTERSRHLRAVRRLSTGAEGSSANFTFERHDGTRFDAKLTRRRLSGRASANHRILPSGFGYLRLTQWEIGVMPRVMSGMEALKDTPGMVIDLRGNPGGSAHAVNALLARFFAKKTDLGGITTRTGQPVAVLFGAVEIMKLKHEAEGRKDAYTGPVVILVNAQSGSGSELFAATMQAAGRASVVGEPSCGCLLGFLGYAQVPGGGELAYSEVGFRLTNGRKIEGVGVIPDRPVPATLADLRVYRDRALEEAEALLRTLPRGAS